MREYTHYGKKVIYQQVIDKSFRDVLKEKGIEYTELPLLNDVVLKHEVNGKTKYAYILRVNAPDDYIENTYITDEIPDDMNWENIALDCYRQQQGEDPMRMKTKACVLCEKAQDMLAQEKTMEELLFPGKIDPEMFQLALIKLGSSLDEILEMNHWDVDDKFLSEMKGEK